MRTDLTQGFLDAVAAGECSRYVVIYINDNPRYFAQTTLQISEDITAIPAVSKFGTKTVGTDLNASVNNISIPAIDRSFALINSIEFGWIAREFVRKTQEGKRVDFRIIANGEDILEDSLVIKEPISYKQSDPEITITCVSSMIARDPLVGTFDIATKAYSSVSVGSIGNAIGSFREDLSSPYCKIKTTALSGTTQISCDRDLSTAGFAATGSITVDFEDIAYSSIGGAENNIFFLSSALTKTHLADQYICLQGGIYYYDYGPGPVDAVGALMFRQDDGTYLPYEGQYSIVNGARVLASFSGFLPNYRKNGTVESSVTKSWSSSNFVIKSVKLSSSGSDFYWANGTSSGVLAAELLDIFATLPAGAIFSRGTTTINFSYNSNDVTVRQTKTQTKYASDVETYYLAYASGGYIYADDPDHGIYNGNNQKFGALANFSISAPANSTFISGNVSVVLNTGYGNIYIGATGQGAWSYVTGTVAGVSRTYGSSSSGQLGVSVNSTYNCSSLSQVNGTSLSFYYKCNYTVGGGGPTVSFPSACALITKVEASATFDVLDSNAILGYGTIRLFGANYSGSRNITASTSDYSSYIDSSVKLYVESDYSKPSLKVASVGQISSTVYYVAEAPGFPKRVVYDAEGSQIKIGQEGSDVNPVGLISNLLVRKNSLIRIDEESATVAASFYDTNSYLMNGYIAGETRSNAAILEVMKESALMIIDRAGSVVIKRRILPAEAESDLFIENWMPVENSISITHQSDDECTNRVSVRYNADAALNYANAYTVEVADSVAKIGAREEVAIDFPHIDGQEFAEYSVNYWANRNSLPFRITEFQLFADQGQVIEYGDFVTLYTSFSSIGGIFGEVVQITTDYVDESSPTIYTITLVSGGTTNEPEWIVLDEEGTYVYEYLNLHRPVVKVDAITVSASGIAKPVEAPEAITMADGTPLSFSSDQQPETITVSASGIAKPVEAPEAITMADGTLVLLSSSKSDSIITADAACHLNVTAIQTVDGVEMGHADAIVMINDTNNWGEFAWGEPGHYWGKNP